MEQDSAEFYAALGFRVRQARMGRGLTQEAVAAQVGLTRTSMTNIEKGRQAVLAHTLCRLAGVLGVRPRDLLPSPSDEASASGP